MIDKIKVVEQKKIISDNGKIMHFIKKSDTEFSGFGEAYFSTVKKNSVKALEERKRLILRMTCNL